MYPGPGADLGGGRGGRTFLSQGLDPLPARRPKCSPLCTILRYLDPAPDPKKILKVHSAPLYSNFEGGELDKKRNCFGQKFSKNA